MRRSFDYLNAVASQDLGSTFEPLIAEMKSDFTTAYFAAAAQHPGLLPADERDRE